MIEQRRRLDIRQAKRRGWLRPGNGGAYSWNRDGEPCGSISYVVLDGALELRYQVSDDEGQWQQVSITIPIRRAPCRFGGLRHYWACPNCYRTCEIVVMASHGVWGCRRCLRLRYLSQGLAPADRLQRRADNLYARAGVESDDGRMIYKHKWMRWRTFNRLMDRANAAARAGDAWFLYRLHRLGFLGVDDAVASVLGEPSPDAQMMDDPLSVA